MYLHQLPLACPAPMHLVHTDAPKEELLAPHLRCKGLNLFHCKATGRFLVDMREVGLAA